MKFHEACVALICLLVVTFTPALADDNASFKAAISEAQVSNPKFDTQMRPVRGAETIDFKNAPYPFTDGLVPADAQSAEKPFFQEQNGLRFHMAPRGGKLLEKEHYSDSRSLLFVAPRFDPDRSGAMLVLFFHGNLATLETVEDRQRVPQQIFASGANAVLVAPALAKNALDSSPGRFYEQDFFDKYLDEAARHLAALSKTPLTVEQVDKLPVVIIAYSGGYLATAFSLHYAVLPQRHRIAGVVLLDALFGETRKFEDWIAAGQGKDKKDRPFFVSTWSPASAGLNLELEQELKSRNIYVDNTVPERIVPGTVAFRGVPAANHNDFVTLAWTKDPLAEVLRRISFDDREAVTIQTAKSPAVKYSRPRPTVKKAVPTQAPLATAPADGAAPK